MPDNESTEQIFSGVVARAIALGYQKQWAIKSGQWLGEYIKARIQPQPEKRWCEITNFNVNVYLISEAFDKAIIEYFKERIRYWRDRKRRERQEAAGKPKPKLEPKENTKAKRKEKASSARTFDLTGKKSTKSTKSSKSTKPAK